MQCKVTTTINNPMGYLTSHTHLNLVFFSLFALGKPNKKVTSWWQLDHQDNLHLQIASYIIHTTYIYLVLFWRSFCNVHIHKQGFFLVNEIKLGISQLAASYKLTHFLKDLPSDF